MHDAGRGVKGCCGGGKAPGSVVILGKADCIQGSHGCGVPTVRRGCLRRQSQGVVVVEGKVWEVWRDKRVW